ncbi:MAG TPA: outer membrane beta-barrel protein [Bacteroidota bacterium]|nr:outer membrane beta-barrel protein [Bacteroidota bacterium]
MKAVSALVTFALISSSALSQSFPDKRVELSFSGGLQSFSSGSGSSSTLFLLTPRVGYFALGGLEVEGEGTFAFAGGSNPAYMLNGLLSYNFPAQGRARVFILAGYGVANSVPTFNVPLLSYNLATLGVLNVGGGLKALLADNVAVRAEYRYQRFTGTQNLTMVDFMIYPLDSEKIDVNLSSVLIGFSILL